MRCFVSFVNILNHSRQKLEKNLLDFFEENDIDIADCRGQSYDNASKISGRYTEMQVNISEINPLALFIAKCGHSLNLVGECALCCCERNMSCTTRVQQFQEASNR